MGVMSHALGYALFWVQIEMDDQAPYNAHIYIYIYISSHDESTSMGSGDASRLHMFESVRLSMVESG